MFVKKVLSVFLVLAVLILSAPLVTAQNPGLSVLVQQVGDRIEVVVSILPVNGLEYCCVSVDFNKNIMSIGSNSNGYSAPGWDYDGVYTGGVENNGNTVKHAALFDCSLNTSAQQAFAKFVFTVKSDVFSEADFTVKLECYEDGSVSIPQGEGFEIYSGTTVIDTSLFPPLPEAISQMDASIKMEDGKINITVSFPPVNSLDDYFVKVYFDKTVVSIENRDGYMAKDWITPYIHTSGIILDGNSVMDGGLYLKPINTSTRKAVSEFVFDIIDTEALTAAFTVCITDYNDSTVSLDSERTIKAFNLTLNCSHSNAHLINASASTCSSEGYSGDLYCPDCLSVLSVGTALAKSDHNPGDWIVDKEPTSLEPGLKHIECMECGEIIETADIPVEATNWEDFISYEKNEGETGMIITDCDEMINGALEIPSEIEGLPVVGIGEYAFEFCSSLTSVRIPDSVKYIGWSAFYFCSSLTDIIIPGGVTSIGQSAFYYTAYYNDLTNWEDGVLYIGSYLIEAKEELNGDYEIKPGTVCIADCAFQSCSLLTSVRIPDGMKYIGWCAFHECALLTSITIPGSVAGIGDYAFAGCTALTEINVDTDNECYRSTDGILFNKDASELLICPEGKTGIYHVPSGVTSIGHSAFNSCMLLTEIIMPDSVKDIGNSAFDGCTSLTGIKLSNNLVSIGGSAFRNCSKLTGVTIPDSVTSIGWQAFESCESLKEISIPGGIKSIEEFVFHCCTSLISVTIPEGITSIGFGAFASCTSLSSITIPKSVTDIGHYAFAACELLTIYCYENSEAENYAIINNIHYLIISEALLPDPDSNLEVDNKLNALTGVSAGITTENLLSQFSGGDIGIYKDGEPLGENELVGTGCEIRLMDGDVILDSLTVVVKGDLDGDGKVNVSDARKALRAAVKLDTISDFQSLAADVDGSKKVEVPDARLILRVAVGLQGF